MSQRRRFRLSVGAHVPFMRTLSFMEYHVIYLNARIKIGCAPTVLSFSVAAKAKPQVKRRGEILISPCIGFDIEFPY